MNGPFRISVEDGIGEFVIDRPPVNALNTAEWRLMAREIDALSGDDRVRSIVIRADGRGFCAGVDIKELAEHPGMIVPVNAAALDAVRAIHRNRVPVIAAVHGFVLGGGILIAGAADVVVSSDCATFGVPEIDRGAMGGGAHLRRLFPLQTVRYMYFTGETITADEAYRLGAVTKPVPREQLRETAFTIARKIASKSPLIIRLAKESLNGIEDGDLEAKYRWEQGFTLEAYSTADSAETRKAFVEKRAAKFPSGGSK